MDDCDGIMTLGLADVSHMSIFNDFDETERDEFHGRIINHLSMITVDSASADNHESVMACFHLMHNGYDAEVMIPVYIMDPSLFYLFQYW